jgi:Asp-tRNA(Asn)/Glu-tRNA(Gln) amidotransferase A subunit family amidase
MQPAHQIAAAVHNGTLSPADALGAALARIDAVEPEVRAWVEIDRDGARQRASELAAARERGEALGPLAGVPVGIKDIIDVAGFPTRAGAPAFAHYNPASDSIVAARLRAAGAIILGKTHTTEFAYLDPAPTRNPWNRAHTPGGSSSGSAAAVGSGMVPLAIGSQTVGSILRPAGYCGVVGLKPTFGRIPYAGTLNLAASFDHVGPICTCVADAALGLSVLAGHDGADPHSVDAAVEDYVAAIASPRAPRLGVPRAYYRGIADSEIEGHLEEVILRFEKAGAQVIEVAMPGTAAEIAEACQPVMRVEAAIAHSERYAAHKDDYRPNIKALIEAGLATDSDTYARARNFVRTLREAMSERLDTVDCLILPTAPGTAPASLETTGPGIFCGPASFTGLPAISLPSGLSPSGLPLSIQLIGPHLGESKLLNAAAWAESILDFRAQPAL